MDLCERISHGILALNATGYHLCDFGQSMPQDNLFFTVLDVCKRNRKHNLIDDGSGLQCP
jgi:hypothetical protein